MIQTITAEEWEFLTEEEREEYRARQERISGGESLRDFIVRMSPHHPPPPHFQPIIDALEAARVEPQRVLISMPPGHGKTVLFLHAIAWWLSHSPGDANAYFSYNATQAHSKSVMSRDLAMRSGVELSDDTNTKGEWRNRSGGGLLSGGVGGGLTGQRVTGLLCIDDPFKGPIDAYSPAYRDSVDEWFRTVALTRLEGGSVFVIHTRWHEDDLIGRLVKRGGWTVINLPAIAEEKDPLGRAEGEALWPEMYPLEKLAQRKEDLGEFSFAALFQGRPRPRGGTVFKDPAYYDPAETSFEGCRISIACDPAATEKTSGDYSAIVVLSIRPGRAATDTAPEVPAVAYVRFVFREQVEIPTLVTRLVATQQAWGNAEIAVESVGGFKAIPQLLRGLGLERIREIVPEGDKFTRAQKVAAAWNVGRVLVPADAPPWLGKFLDELAKFTGVKDAHDDQVDALSHAYNKPVYLSLVEMC